MDEPREERQADAAEQASPPDFDALTPPEDLVRGDRTRDDFLDAVLTLDQPATAGEVAELAGRGADAAREYLTWFERMGIVTRVTDTPATYKRNQEYLQWRRVQRLRQQYTTDELLAFLDDAVERADGYATEFGVDSPEGVSIAAYATEHDRSLEDVWEAVSMWKTTRRQIALLERALQQAGDDAAHDTASA